MREKSVVLGKSSKMRSDEQIGKSEFDNDSTKKGLKEKSKSSNALKVGPFAAIKESEKRKKINGSLDLEEESEEKEERHQQQRVRASTTGAK
ncbi:hypothetical protein niasHS_007558 [Heterodera schachtii]|uniref:Uncharacterized protein n=1 Tax=Heterodera schachtii TaxID=97005 RepID=A0ABD2JXV0_HETSC